MIQNTHTHTKLANFLIKSTKFKLVKIFFKPGHKIFCSASINFNVLSFFSLSFLPPTNHHHFIVINRRIFGIKMNQKTKNNFYFLTFHLFRSTLFAYIKLNTGIFKTKTHTHTTHTCLSTICSTIMFSVFSFHLTHTQTRDTQTILTQTSFFL